MIDFWARLDESDVEKYAKTLILPEYMSHLSLRPFSLSEQRESASGREPLTLVYVGDGRLEELELQPERDALPLIASLPLGLNPEKIRLSNNGACWTWNEFGPSHPFFANSVESEKSDKTPPNDAASSRFLRVYFEPREKTFSKTLRFDAQDAYVSVSRREIFFSWRVLEAYLKARCLDLLAPSSRDVVPPNETAQNVTPENDAPENDAEPQAITPRRVDFAWDANFRPFGENYVASSSEAPKAETTSTSNDAPDATNGDAVVYALRSFVSSPSPIKPPPFVFDFDDQNIRFRFGPVAGSLVVANDETFEDALRFSGLTPTLNLLANYVYFDVRRSTPRLDETGVRLRLFPVESVEKEDA